MKNLDFSGYTGLKEESLKKAINKLLSETFIVKEDDRNTYEFIKNYDIDINNYFNIMGYSLEVRENEGYCCLMRDKTDECITRDPNTLTLSNDEKIILAVFWQIFIERFIENAVIRVSVSRIELVDILKDYLPTKITSSPAQLELTLKVFKKHNIIKVQGDIKDDTCEIRIYPSVMMALNENEIRVFMDDILTTSSNETLDDNEGETEDETGEEENN